ncbi:efflux RND transporter periplasmic adaptor subunit [Pseudogemmobacter bohemicus]|uniref:efflux RND transporter periplasmic adaptor subunit n=1 Tax=Pseudogemmobacter bohemicus TaxID=2250708 RepID=UPI0013005224|nr:efflux RND transporter periplasmic adaptor subunit [Pseudogemmobacter bohemicus]
MQEDQAAQLAKDRVLRGGYAGLLLPLLVAGGIGAWALMPGERLAPQARAAEVPVAKLLDPVELIELAPRPLREVMPLTGEVRPLRHVTLSAEIGGVVTGAGPQEGESIAAGAVLLTIADGDYRLALGAAEAGLAALLAERHLAALTLERATELAGRGATARAALESADAALAKLDADIAGARIRVDQARADLDRTRLVTPFAGEITRRLAEPGQLVSPGDALFGIADLSVLTVTVLIPAAQAQALSPGQEAQFWFPAAPDTRFAARLARIGAETTAESRAVPVWFTLTGDHPGLRAGSFLTGALTLRQKPDALALPQSALREAESGAAVLTIRNGTAELVPVTTGASWPGGLIDILSGLRPGDLVVGTRLPGLEPGNPVRIGGH